MAYLDLPPRLQKQRRRCLKSKWASGEAISRFALNNAVGVNWRNRSANQSSDYCGRGAVWYVPKDLVGTSREREFQEVPECHVNVSSVCECRPKIDRETLIKLHGDKTTTTLGKLIGEFASARPYLNDQVAARYGGLLDQPSRE